MTDNKNPRPTSGEIGLMNLGATMGQSMPEQLADFLKQWELARVMASVVADQRYDPNPRSMADTPTKRGTGWVDSRPLESPGGQQTQDLIAGMTPSRSGRSGEEGKSGS
jgi:hypothetical protein